MGITGTWMNLMFGTGQEQISQAIKTQLAGRAATNQSYISAIATGTKNGIVSSYNSMAQNGGFWQSVKNGFSAISQGWKNGQGLGKLTGALKGCGKAMPALMAGMILLSEIPNTYKAVKHKGLWQGVKELGKSATRLTFGAICGAIGTAICPWGFVGGIVGWMAGDWIARKIVGKSYSEKLAENQGGYQGNNEYYNGYCNGYDYTRDQTLLNRLNKYDQYFNSGAFNSGAGFLG